MNIWLALLLLLVAHGLWLLLVRWLGKLGVEAELTRKIFHAGIGTQLLAMPLLFQQEILPVLVWGLLSAGAVGMALLLPDLRNRMAGNVYDVGRISYGDLYFVLGVVLLYFFAASTYYTYAVPLTMLSFADATSALVGKRFGRHKFEAVEGRKSIEGSLAFFMVAFIATLLWVPTLPNADPLQVALIAVILGLVVMLLEAISWRGLDNLLIPLGGFLLLRTYLMMSPGQLIFNLGFVTLLVVFVIAWRRRSTLNHSALITGALFGYTAWTVAGAFLARGNNLLGLAWLVPPLLLFLLYNTFAAPQLLEERHRRHNVDSVLAAVFSGAVWLYVAFELGRPEFIYPYCVSFACVALIMFFERSVSSRKTPLAFGGLLIGGLLIVGIGVLMLWLLDPAIATSRMQGLALAAAAGLATAVLLRLSASAVLSEEKDYQWRWHVRGLAALAGSAIVALPLSSWTVLQLM